MKPYQIFTCNAFPLNELRSAGSLSNVYQFNLFKEDMEEISTDIIFVNEYPRLGIYTIRINSAVPINAHGYIRYFSPDKPSVERIPFKQYLLDVSFLAHWHKEENIIIFQENKDICRNVFKQLHGGFKGLDIRERTVDFSKIHMYVNEFFSTWFKGISTEVQSANLSGHNIQDDTYFKEFLNKGIISNVTIPITCGAMDHRVMVTRRSGVILVENYKNDIEIELEVVMATKRKIVEKIWEPIDITQEACLSGEITED